MKGKKILAIAVAFALVIGSVQYITAAENEVLADDCGVTTENYEMHVSESSDYEYQELLDGTLRLIEYKGTDKDVVIPSVIEGKKVTELYHAFSYNNDISSVTVPNSVKYLESDFYCCYSLTEINIDSENTEYASLNGIVYNKNCTKLLICPAGKKGSITIPDSVTQIGRYAFSYCSLLTAVFVPSSISQGIDVATFQGCSALTEINVDPENATYTSINGIVYNKNCTELLLCPGGKKGNVIIPDNVIKICSGAFNECSLINEIEIPDSVAEIGREAFEDCTSLTSINIPNSVTEIGDSAFSGCSSLASINIPDSVTEISYFAFSGCSSLTSINIPDNITTIGWYAFSHCTSLSSFTFPKGVTEIAYKTFYNCTSLSSIDLPENLESINDNAFYGCKSLTTIEIPPNVTSIGSMIGWGESFAECTALKSVIVPESLNHISSNTFSNCSEDITIYGVSGSYAETFANENDINFNGIKSEAVKDNTFGIEVNVGVSAPSDTVLSVEKISENTEGVTYNITLTSDGEKIDFKGERAVVRIPVPVDDKAYDYKVYRKETNEEYTDMQASVSNHFLLFFTDHFSEYVVTTEQLIPDTIAGDVNNDKSVNDRDSISLDRYLGDWDIDILLTAADLNGDGKVNDQDSIILARTLAGWYE